MDIKVYTCWLFMYITKINDVFFHGVMEQVLFGSMRLVKRGKAWLPERTSMTGDVFFFLNPTHENGDFGFIGFTTLLCC